MQDRLLLEGPAMRWRLQPGLAASWRCATWAPLPPALFGILGTTDVSDLQLGCLPHAECATHLLIQPGQALR
eukprot:11208092-Lingulodinium_polyedra.AAC.1